MIGQTFGRLTVLSKGESYRHSPKNGNRLQTFTRWVCKCECGMEVLVRGAGLRNGTTKSCGCLQVEKTVTRTTKHGYAKRIDGNYVNRTYRIYLNMKSRCSGHDRPDARWYKDKGIAVCNRWKESFEHFLADMGECPDGYSLDRIDSDKNYEPSNCRWLNNIENIRRAACKTRYTRFSKKG